jgi:uncharacterized delta-60 repeat protein
MNASRHPTSCLVVCFTLLHVGPAFTQGGVDTFNPQLNGGVESTTVQPDGKILISGGFTRVGTRYVTNLARLYPDGSMDTNFLPRFGMYGRRIVVQPDGKVLVGGIYQQNTPNFRGLVRFESNGDVDTSFDAPSLRDLPFALALQADGKVLAGFQTPPYIARFHADGRPETNFLARPDNVVYDLVTQPDGKILAAGYFHKMNDQVRRFLARLNADGSLDTGFNAEVGFAGYNWGVVRKVAVQADGKILFGGGFTSAHGAPRRNLARLNADGTLDVQFRADTDWEVHALVVQPNTKIVVAGDFTTLNGRSRIRLGRVNWDGSLDPTLTAGANAFIRSAALQPDGRTVVGGQFNLLGGEQRTYVGRVTTDPSTGPVFIDLASVKVIDGALQFSFLNPNGVAYSVLATEDVTAPLAGWEILGTAVPAGNGVYQFTDSSGATQPRRFYRLRTP